VDQVLPAEPSTRRRRRVVVSFAALGVIVALLLLLTARLFLWPATDRPDRADAVVMLAGDLGDRIELAKALIANGVAATLVHAGQPDTGEAFALCGGGQAFEVICLSPDPDNTRSEAQATAQLVASRGWRSIVVVTSTSHVTRSGLLFRRCTEATVKMVESKPRSVPIGIRLRALVHEWGGLLRAAALDRRC